ncbi:uncharacterized protein K02A2.6-like [Diachasma alloeum]|uniref:uncharacterized protein K02A2.6-like n=1 Tax=Diachasma alloeum TaxID=454923 RepID=UPI0007384B4B|nr:uncharacterized protein K02A2.6-like [Diachasma alloeum]
MRDQFVWGLKDDSIKRKLLAEKDVSYERAIEIASAMEAARRDMVESSEWGTPIVPILKKNGVDNISADYLSRAFESSVEELGENEKNDYGYLNFVEEEIVLFDSDLVKSESEKDSVIKKVISFVLGGWPRVKEEGLEVFECRKLELHVERGCLLWGHRVVVPTSLRAMVLKELHASHMGIVKMKALARSYVWWPNIDHDIELVPKSCLLCLENGNKPPRNPLTVWKWPEGPQFRIQADFAGPINGKMFIIIVDAYSKWIDVREMANITSESTIEIFEDYFAVWGIPVVLVTDNGTSFTSKEFEDFVKYYGVEHIRTPPYHPASNGAAENIVKTFKNKLKVLMKSGKSAKKALRIFLMSYRATPHCTTGFTPAELQMGRKMRIKLDFLRPNLRHRVVKQQVKQQFYAPGTHQRSFEIGQRVMAANHSGDNFVLATVEEQLSPVVYLVKTMDNRLWKRHVDQLKGCAVFPDHKVTTIPNEVVSEVISPSTSNNSELFSHSVTSENNVITPVHETTITTPSESATQAVSTTFENQPVTLDVPAPVNIPDVDTSLRRSTRVRRAPTRLNL